MNTTNSQLTGPFKRYTDAYVVARVTVGLGNLIKIIGISIGCGISLMSIILTSIVLAETHFSSVSGGISGSILCVIGVCFGSVLGLIIFIFGMFLAAQGQILMASLDCAVNSSPFLAEEEKAKAMSLRIVQKSDSLPPILPVTA